MADMIEGITDTTEAILRDWREDRKSEYMYPSVTGRWEGCRYPEPCQCNGCKWDEDPR